MWTGNQRVFYQSPAHVDKNKSRAERLEIWPGLSASGEPGAYMTTDKFRLFVTEAQAIRVSNELLDAIEYAEDMTAPIHTSQTKGT